MGKVTMECWRVRWTGKGDEKMISAAAYPKNLADIRADELRARGYRDVEVYQSKPGSEEGI